MKGCNEMKKLLALSLIVLACVLTSCGKDDKITIGSVIFEGTNEWFVEAIAGMEDAAKKANVNLIKSDSHYDIMVERDLIQEQIKSKADAIVICPLTVKESGATLKEAADMGLPIVTWNTVVEPAPTVQVVVDNKILGSDTGKYISQYIQKNNITKLNALLIINTEFSIGLERCNGFKNSVRPLIDSGVMTTAATVKGHLYEETCVSVEKILREQPDINFIWCWNQMTTNAAVETLKTLGRSDIIVAGTDMSMALAKEMLNNDVNIIAITTQQPYEMGYQAVEAAVKAVKGEKQQTSISIPTITYTKENADAVKKYIEEHKKFVTGG